MGAAEHWQEHIVEALKDEQGIILNPRRDEWDSSWNQSKDDPQFREQVEWELAALAKSTYIILYFDKDTKSPISLLEIGLFAQSGKLLIVCPDGYWRKGNVDIVCEKYGFFEFPTLDALVHYIIPLIRDYTDNYLK